MYNSISYLGMEKFTVSVLLIWVFQAHVASYQFLNNNYLLIDCGQTGTYSEFYNNQSWLPDNLFIVPGKTMQLTSQDHDIPQVMNTLRYFENHLEDLNCYPLPLINTEKFIFRAGFYYANYDGKSQAPVFDLLLGGQLWETVDTSASGGPIFQELIYRPNNGNISVCLMGKDGGTPFISSLEATYLEHDDNVGQKVYRKMRNGRAYHLVSRLNFGPYDKVLEPWSGLVKLCEEDLNRYWTPQPMPAVYTNITFEADHCTGQYYENRPPDSVFNTAISPSEPSQSIYVPLTFPTATPHSAYVVLYFFQNLNSSETIKAPRYMDIYVDGVKKETVKLEDFISGEVVTLYPLLVQGTTNVTISPADGTKLPPLLNGMEVFVANELVEQAASSGFKISSYSFTSVILIFQLVICVFLVYI